MRLRAYSGKAEALERVRPEPPQPAHVRPPGGEGRRGDDARRSIARDDARAPRRPPPAPPTSRRGPRAGRRRRGLPSQRRASGATASLESAASRRSRRGAPRTRSRGGAATRASPRRSAPRRRATGHVPARRRPASTLPTSFRRGPALSLRPSRSTWLSTTSHCRRVRRERSQIALVQRRVRVLLRVDHPDQQIHHRDQTLDFGAVRGLDRVEVGQVEQHESRPARPRPRVTARAPRASPATRRRRRPRRPPDPTPLVGRRRPTGASSLPASTLKSCDFPTPVGPASATTVDSSAETEPRAGLARPPHVQRLRPRPRAGRRPDRPPGATRPGAGRAGRSRGPADRVDGGVQPSEAVRLGHGLVE